MTATTHRTQSTGSQMLFLSLELSKSTWRITSGIGPGLAPRERRLAAGSAAALVAELAHAKRRFGLPADAPVRSCYEAGRDGFWVHRWLTELGVDNVIVDSSKSRVARAGQKPIGSTGGSCWPCCCGSPAANAACGRSSTCRARRRKIGGT